MIKKLLAAAVALCAFAAFTPLSSYFSTSRKTGSIDFHDFDDLTVERTIMDAKCTLLSEYTRCVAASEAIASDLLGSNCYVDGFFVDTAQLTVPSTSVQGNFKSADFSESVVRATAQLTVQSTITNEINEATNTPSSNRSEFSTSTIGTDEGTQLKARLA